MLGSKKTESSKEPPRSDDICKPCGTATLRQFDDVLTCVECGFSRNQPLLDHWAYWGEETYLRPKKRYRYRRQGHLKKQLQKILSPADLGSELIPAHNQEAVCISRAVYPLFQQLEVSFDKVVAQPGETRHNFLSYHYVLFKILELLGHDELLFRCKLLKSPARRLELERLWKLICSDAGWEYIKLKPTD